jgi:hypothetical protein
MSSHLLLLVSLIATFDTSYPAFLRAPFLGLPGSGDIIQQTRSQADTLKATLRSLTSKPEAAPILQKVFIGKNGGCLQNMDEAIEAIETSTKLFENAGTEIKQLVSIVQSLQDLSDTPKAVRETAKIIRLLDVLIPKITPSTSVCRTSSADVFDSMRSLGALVEELSSKDDLYFSTQKRQSLKSSAQIVSKVTNFLAQESHFKFAHFCTKDKEYNKDFLTAIGKMMSDLADLYTALGGVTAANGLRKQEDFTKRVVVSLAIISKLYLFLFLFFLQANINKLGDLNILTLDCNTPGSSQLVANTMDDLAGIIEDVGMENLCKQLDLEPADCTF